MTFAGSSREDTFETMFRAHIAVVRRFAQTMVTDGHVEDIVAQTFSTAWQRLDEIPVGATQPWLLGVARNHCRNTWRSDRRARALIDKVAFQSSNPLFATENSAEVDPVLQVIRELDDADRELMVLAGWFEMTPTEIASMTEDKVGTVRVRLHRVRRKIRDRLEQEVGGGDVA